MKKKRESKWCEFPAPKLDADTKKRKIRCQCGRKLHLVPVFDSWDSIKIVKNGKIKYVAEIVWWTLPRHKTKTKYKDENN